MLPLANGDAPAADKPTAFPVFVDSSQDAGKNNVQEKKKSENGLPGHKRSTSGNLLSKLAFLRSSSEADREAEVLTTGKQQSKPNGALDVQQGSKTRKRKGSLRKSVLGRSRDRKDSENRTKSPLSSTLRLESEVTPLSQPRHLEQNVTPRSSQELSSPASPESPPRWPFRSLSKASLPSIRSSIASVYPASSVASIASPSIATDVSTDDDEQISPHLMVSTSRQPPSTSGDSYFPPTSRRLPSHTKSPLATQPQSISAAPLTEPEEWDYSETAFWGYVILIVTWIVFVVGVGSSFGVWSWAWDVGETPYAPPELEDDPTLPIVGYYPALLVLTCVMAWVWVVVAWVGMKYFKHADLRGDDG